MKRILPKEVRLVPPQAKRVFKGMIFDVYQWQQKMFDGSFQTFEMLKRPDGIQVLAIKDDKIVMLDEEQPGHQAFIGLPGGRHDVDGESELDAAKRELLEETGMTFKKWKLISVEQPHFKIEGFVYLFLATDFDKQVEPHAEPGERIIVKLLSLDEVKRILDDPKARRIPKDLLEKVDSIDELLNLPAYV